MSSSAQNDKTFGGRGDILYPLPEAYTVTHKKPLIIDDPVDAATKRKQRPVFSGVLKYFPLAIMEVAHCSWVGNEQHNPGQPLHWDRSKSSDELDAHVRHLMDMDDLLEKDDDGSYHLAKAIWRLCAMLQKELEAENAEQDKECCGNGNAGGCEGCDCHATVDSDTPSGA